MSDKAEGFVVFGICNTFSKCNIKLATISMERKMNKIRKHITFKLISIILIITFLNLDIARAYPSISSKLDNLAVQSPWQINMMGDHGAEFQKSVFSRRDVFTTVMTTAKYMLDEGREQSTVTDVLGAQLDKSGIPVIEGIAGGRIDLRYIKWKDEKKKKVVLIPFSREGYFNTDGENTHIIQIAHNEGMTKNELIGYDYGIDAVDGKSRYVAKIVERAGTISPETSAKFKNIITTINEGLDTDANELLGSFTDKELAGVFEILEAYAEREDEDVKTAVIKARRRIEKEIAALSDFIGSDRMSSEKNMLELVRIAAEVLKKKKTLLVGTEYTDPIFKKLNLIPSFTVDTRKERPINKVPRPLSVEIPSVYPGLVDELGQNGLLNIPAKTLHLAYVKTGDSAKGKRMFNLGDPRARMQIENGIIFDMIEKLEIDGPVSLHLGWAIKDFEAVYENGLESQGHLLMNEEEAFEIIVENIKLIKQEMAERGLENKILLENGGYFPGANYVLRHDFIRRVAGETGCGFLIDLGHIAHVALRGDPDITGEGADTPIDYLKKIIDQETVKLLGEVHISVPLFDKNTGRWEHSGERGRPWVSFHEDTEGVRMVKELFEYIIDLREETDIVKTHPLIVNFETNDDLAREEVLALSAMLKNKMRVDFATRACKLFNRFNVICGFSLNASKNPRDTQNSSFRKGLKLFRDIFNLSEVKAPHSFEDQCRTETEVDRIGQENLFHADKRTFHIRKMVGKDAQGKDKYYSMDLTDPKTAEMFGNLNSPLYSSIVRMRPELVSIHLSSSAEDISYGSDNHNTRPFNVAMSVVLTRQKVLETIVANINLLQKNLKKAGYDKPVLLETLDYHNTGAYEYVTDPDFVNEVVDRTGAHLLIDCAHLFVSAKNMPAWKARPYMDYVKKIVNERTIRLVNEIHLTVPGSNITHAKDEAGDYIDYHHPFYADTPEGDAVRDILSYILELRENMKLTEPVVINFETDVEEAVAHVAALAKTLTYLEKKKLPAEFKIPEREFFERMGERWDWKKGDGVALLIGAPFDEDARQGLEEVLEELRGIEQDPQKLYLQEPEHLHITVADLMPNTESVSRNPVMKKNRVEKARKARSVSMKYGSVAVRFYYKDLALTKEGDIIALGYADSNLIAFRDELQREGVSSRRNNIVHITIGRIFDKDISSEQLDLYKTKIVELRERQDEKGEPALLCRMDVDELKFWDQAGETNDLRYGGHFSSVKTTKGSDVRLRSLTKEFASKHAKRLIELQNTIPDVNWVKGQLLAEEWKATDTWARGDKVFLGKWEHSVVAVDSLGNPVGLLLAYERPFNWDQDMRISTGHKVSYEIDDEMKKVGKRSLYIHGFVCDENYQGMGIGAMMMREVAGNLLKNGYYHLKKDSEHVITLKFDKNSLYLSKVYKKLGFKEVGETITVYPEGQADHKDFIYAGSASNVLALLSYKSEFARNHAQRVERIAQLLARNLGVSKQIENELSLACVIHDLDTPGKTEHISPEAGKNVRKNFKEKGIPLPEKPQGQRDVVEYNRFVKMFDEGGDKFTSEERDFVLDLFEPCAALKAAESNGLQLSDEVKTAVLFHHDIGALEHHLEGTGWSRDKKEATIRIASLLVAADTIEKGMNHFKWILLKGDKDDKDDFKVETSEETMGWLRDSGIPLDELGEILNVFNKVKDSEELKEISKDAGEMSKKELQDLKKVGRTKILSDIVDSNNIEEGTTGKAANKATKLFERVEGGMSNTQERHKNNLSKKAEDSYSRVLIDDIYASADQERFEVLEKRRVIRGLFKNKDVGAIEDIILKEDARSDKEKDWPMLSEAVAYRNKIGFSKNRLIMEKYQHDLKWLPADQGRRDIHLHSSMSDAYGTIDEIIQQAVRDVVKVISITDHSCLLGIDRGRDLGEKYGVIVIPGVELGFYHEIDSVNKEGVNVHILAYGIDPKNKQLVKMVREGSIGSQLKWFTHTFKMLNFLDKNIGLRVLNQRWRSAEGVDLREWCGNENPGPEEVLTQTLMAANWEFADKCRKNGLEEDAQRIEKEISNIDKTELSDFVYLVKKIVNSSKEYTLTVAEYRLLEKVMLVQTDADPEINIRLSDILKDLIKETGKDFVFLIGYNKGLSGLPILGDDPARLAAVIRSAGGISQFAHPKWYPLLIFPELTRSLTEQEGFAVMEKLVESCLKQGLSGVEGYSYYLEEEKQKPFVDIAKRCGALISWGSDCHLLQDNSKINNEFAQGIDNEFYMSWVETERLMGEIDSRSEEKLKLFDIRKTVERMELDFDNIVKEMKPSRLAHAKKAIESLRQFVEKKFIDLYGAINPQSATMEQTPNKDKYVGLLNKAYEIYDGLGERDELVLRLAVMLHDVGYNKSGSVTEHWNIGARESLAILRRYGIKDDKLIGEVRDIVRTHGRIADLGIDIFPEDFKRFSQTQKDQMLIMAIIDTLSKVDKRNGPSFSFYNGLSAVFLKDLLRLHEYISAKEVEGNMDSKGFYRGWCLRCAGIKREHQLSIEGLELTNSEVDYMRRVVNNDELAVNMWNGKITNSIFPIFKMLRMAEDERIRKVKKLHKLMRLFAAIVQAKRDETGDGDRFVLKATNDNNKDEFFKDILADLDGFFEMEVEEITENSVRQELERTGWTSVFGLNITFQGNEILVDKPVSEVRPGVLMSSDTIIDNSRSLSAEMADGKAGDSIPEGVDDKAADKVTKLFEIVEGEANNRRDRLVEKAKGIISFLKKRDGVDEDMDFMPLNRDTATPALIKQLRAVANEGRKHTDERKMVAAAKYIEGNLDLMEIDSIVISIIIRARKAARLGRTVTIALDFGWIPGYAEDKSVRDAVNPVVGRLFLLQAALESMELENVRVVVREWNNDKEQHESVEDWAKAITDSLSVDKNFSDVVVFGGMGAVRHFENKWKTDKTGIKERAFLAGVNSSELKMETLPAGDYWDIEIIGMLSAALEAFNGKQEVFDLPIVDEIHSSLSQRKLIFKLPDAGSVNMTEVIEKFKAERRAMVAL
jgi:uncharacterized protein (UPF0276 family)/ribosomal protein S18 acetylase RimI-like enzyme